MTRRPAAAPVTVRMEPDARAAAEALLAEGETLSDAIRLGLELLAVVRPRARREHADELEWVGYAADDRARLSAVVEELEEQATSGTIDAAGRALLRRLDPVIYAAVCEPAKRRR